MVRRSSISRNGREGEFWEHIEKLRTVSSGYWMSSREAVKKLYSREKAEDIAFFWRELEKRLKASYRWDIWSVGAIVGGVISPKFSPSYLIWIILQGREQYDAVFEDPTYPAQLIPVDADLIVFDFRDLQRAIRDVYEDSTGRELPDLWKSVSDREPAGKEWTWRDLPKLHPRLWERFFLHRDHRSKRSDIGGIEDEHLTWFAVRPIRFWVDIYDDPEYFLEQYKQLNAHQKALHAVTWMIDEVNNGGYDQFFFNSTGIVAPEALEGLRRFGAKQRYQELAEIMASFPGGAPERDRMKRHKQMKKQWGETIIDDHFPKITAYRETDAIVAKYVRTHPDEFFRSQRTEDMSAPLEGHSS